MIQAPSWLPFSVRAVWDGLRIRNALSGLDRTPSLSAAADADAEIHMLLCRRDMKLGVLALKSLLRHHGARFAVALTDDGSLSEGDRGWVDRHLPGCRWLSRHVDDEGLRGFLRTHPRLAALYEGPFPFIRKLLHPILLARSGRVLALDSDTAFFARPERLIRWARGEGDHAWYLHDHQDEAEAVPSETREAFADLASRLTPAGRTWNMSHFFFNAGLLAYPPALCNLDLAEQYLEWRSTAPPRFLSGKSSIWFGEWTMEQTSYLVMYALMAPPARPLGDNYRIGGAGGYTFNHFLRTHLVKAESLGMPRRLVAEMQSGEIMTPLDGSKQPLESRTPE